MIPDKRRRTAGHDRQAQGKEYHRGAIVQQALALDQNRQPLRRAQTLEERHDGNRIRGGDER